MFSVHREYEEAAVMTSVLFISGICLLGVFIGTFINLRRLKFDTLKTIRLAIFLPPSAMMIMIRSVPSIMKSLEVTELEFWRKCFFIFFFSIGMLPQVILDLAMISNSNDKTILFQQIERTSSETISKSFRRHRVA